jgi:Gamma-glutamyl cyclotransferase, AIG2-like
MSLYFAYGSNLSKVQMHCRCPDAVPVGSLTLEDWTLVFRAVADIAPSPGDTVQGAVWKLSPSDEATLDQCEGIAKGTYRKVYIPIEPFDFAGDHHTDMLVYVMNSTGIMPPTISYLRTIRDGYRDFALPLAALDDAVERSHDDKAPSHIERQRRMRSGRPPLAARPSAIRAAREAAAKAEREKKAAPLSKKAKRRAKAKEKKARRGIGSY